MDPRSNISFSQWKPLALHRHRHHTHFLPHNSLPFISFLLFVHKNSLHYYFIHKPLRTIHCLLLTPNIYISFILLFTKKICFSSLSLLLFVCHQTVSSAVRKANDFKFQKLDRFCILLMFKIEQELFIIYYYLLHHQTSVLHYFQVFFSFLNASEFAFFVSNNEKRLCKLCSSWKSNRIELKSYFFMHFQTFNRTNIQPVDRWWTPLFHSQPFPLRCRSHKRPHPYDSFHHVEWMDAATVCCISDDCFLL